MAEENPWIEHAGDKCPVEAGTIVDARYRDGSPKFGLVALEITSGWRDASARFWVTSDRRHSDIIAYRIVTP